MLNLFLTGENAAADATGGGMGGSGLTTIIMLVVMVAVFYFFMYRPQKKQERATNDMRNSLQVGDEITTIGGIVGKVVNIKDPVVDIETGRNGTKLRILKSAIKSVDVKAEDC